MIYIVLLQIFMLLTSNPSPKILSINIYNAVCDFLALGLSPDKTTFWVQSDVPEVTELAWILSSYTNLRA